MYLDSLDIAIYVTAQFQEVVCLSKLVLLIDIEIMPEYFE